MFNRFCELGNRCIGITLRDAVAHAVLQVPFQDNLPHFMKRTLGGVDLHEDVLAGSMA